MTPLTVLCVLVAGPYAGFSVDYVVRLEQMVHRHLARPFRFVCLTDGTRGTLPRMIETLPCPASGPGCLSNGLGYWAKLQLFNPSHGLTGRILYLDLDTLVVSTLDPIVDYPAAFALAEDALVTERAHLDRDRYGRRLVRRFNSSVMVWDAGACDELFTRWRPADAERLSTDQDWIGEQSTLARGMPLSWFPRISQVSPPFRPDAKVILVKKPKNAEAVMRWDWVAPLWGAA